MDRSGCRGYFLANKLLSILALSAAVGCSSTPVPLPVNIPMNRFQTPHTCGAFLDGHIQGIVSGGVEVSVVQDITASSPLFGGTSINRISGSSSTGGFDLALGLASFLDVISLYSGEGLKVQVFGFDKNSWQMSLQVAQSSSTTNASTTNSSGSYSAANSLSGRESGISFGKQFADSATAYGSFAYRDLTGTTQISQPTATTLLSDTGTQRLFSAGLVWEAKYFMIGAEYTVGTTTWTRATDLWISSWGFDTGFRW